MNKCIISTLAISFWGLAGSVSLAQQSPSYEQTVGFIEAKTNIASTPYIAKDTGIKHQYKSRITFPARCVLEKAHDTLANGIVDYELRETVSVASLDPSRVFNRSNQILIYTFENRENFAAKIRLNSGAWKPQKNIHSIHINTFDRERNLPKLQKALVHLIKLCGGKEELF